MTLSQYANMFSAKRTYHGCTSSLSKPTLYRSGEQTAVQLHAKTRKESVKPDLPTFQKPVYSQGREAVGVPCEVV